ncbi:putative bifunctional diguanylate cyclase/phosphodiesterase [Pannonibacter tanglangensis]|uniref:EAL domain-containing protein n=1 Tax=Pannonibacter tanglangensis TaxID=2750084 RepID=A0ABW9ZII0_9HYPH|nr:EAL domain-containing protein [Pannonibacter sp. XCT-34]NBN64601.1 EAL domain-containing protein [Pannonibacter sp. XCT-34]
MSLSEAGTDLLDAIDPRELLAQVDRIATAMWVYDFDRKRIVWGNRSALDVWGAASLCDLRKRDLGADMSRAVAERLAQYRTDFLRADATFSENWTIYPNGVPKTLQVVFRGLRLRDGRMAMLCEGTVNHDIRPETLRSAEALLHTPVMISLFSRNGAPLYRNPASRASQIDADLSLHNRLVDASVADALTGALDYGSDCKVVAQTRTSRGIRWHEITARACRDAVTGVPAYLVSEIDVTELKETQERARFFADHDILTGLPNRVFLQAHLPKMIRTAVSDAQNLFLYFLDLNGFKTVNDTLGHAIGDLLLKAVAGRLAGFVAERGTVARLGGDEFLICMPDRTGTLNPQEFGRQLIDLFLEPMDIGGHVLQTTLAVGLSICPDDGADMDTLMRHCDLALFEAKSDRSSKVTAFSMDLRQRLEEKVTLEKDLWRALERDEFVLFYQPRLSVKTGEIVAAEALIRWQHPERGLLGPGSFIPACEETGMIINIGEWVYRNVARQQTRMQEAGIDISLSINLSPRQFSDPDLIDKILHLPEETGCNPERLGFEITESVLLGDSEAIRMALARMKKRGYQIIIDDFGTGYSNLAYLQKYPIDVLKIDQTFIRDLKHTAPITRLIVSLGQVLKVRIVAEGVEQGEELDWLVENGCDEYQGFYFSRPVPFDDFARLYAANRERQELLARMRDGQGLRVLRS